MNNVMNVDEIEGIIKKLHLYKNELELNKDKIEIICDQLLSCYSTDNTSSLSDINFELSKELNNLHNLNNEMINKLYQEVAKYKEFDRYTKSTLQDINTGGN